MRETRFWHNSPFCKHRCRNVGNNAVTKELCGGPFSAPAWERGSHAGKCRPISRILSFASGMPAHSIVFETVSSGTEKGRRHEEISVKQRDSRARPRRKCYLLVSTILRWSVAASRVRPTTAIPPPPATPPSPLSWTRGATTTRRSHHRRHLRPPLFQATVGGAEFSGP